MISTRDWLKSDGNHFVGRQKVFAPTKITLPTNHRQSGHRSQPPPFSFHFCYECESVSSVNIFYLQWTMLFTSPNCISFYIIIGCRSNLGCPLPFLKPLWNWSYSFKLFQHKKVFILCFPKMTSNIQPQNIFYHLVFPPQNLTFLSNIVQCKFHLQLIIAIW